MKLLLLLATAFAVASSSIVASAAGSDRATPNFQKAQTATETKPVAAKPANPDRPERSAKAVAEQAAPAKAKIKTASAKRKPAAITDAAGASAKTVARAKDRKAKPELIAKARKSKVEIDTTTTASITAPAKSNGAYGAIVSRHAAANGVPASLAHAVIRVESNYRVDALGSAGEIGLMQIKPSTARMLGYTGSAKGLYNPETNIKYGLKYLGMAHKLGGGNTCGTILRYNAGHAATRMNPISAAYCSKVKRHLAG